MKHEPNEVEMALMARGFVPDENVQTWRRELTPELDLVVSNGSGEAAKR